MKFNKYTIKTTTEAEDIISSTLMDLGIEGVEIEDKLPLSDQDKAAMFVDILPQAEADDGIAYLSFYLDADEDNGPMLESVREELDDLKSFMDVGECTIIATQLQDTDYLNNWKQYFHQFYINADEPGDEDILIVPSWEEVKEEDKGKMIIHIDPGTAFGTGMHETTQLCIKQLRKYIKKRKEDKDFSGISLSEGGVKKKEYSDPKEMGDRNANGNADADINTNENGNADADVNTNENGNADVDVNANANANANANGVSLLDVGTGSGILSIMAYKFGATSAVGTDLDPCAIEAVQDNMEKNGLDEAGFKLIIGNIIDSKEIQDEVGYNCYDIVVANILAEVLVPLTPVIVNHLKPGGIYITSGIIDDKEQTVVDAVRAAGLEVLEVNHRGEWVSVTARK